MRITAERNVFSEKSTISQVHVDDRFECYFLEDKDRKLEDGGEKIYGETAIPRGIYEVVVNESPKYGKDLPLLLNVEGYEGVRIHPGNFPIDTEGCLLPGDSFAEDFVGNSRATFGKLFNKIEAAIARKEKVTLEII